MSTNKTIEEMIDAVFEEEEMVSEGIVPEEAEHFDKFMGAIHKTDKRLKSTVIKEATDYETGDRPARKYDIKYRERPLNSTYWGPMK